MATCAQYLVMCGIDLVLLLLLLTFRDALFLYSLVLIRTITAPGIPVRRKKYLNKKNFSQYFSLLFLGFSICINS